MANGLKYEFNPLSPMSTPIDFAGTNLGIYAVESTQRFVCGTRYKHWDGSEYRYCKSTTAIHTSQACSFTHTGATAWTAAGIAANIGDRVVTAPAATHAAAFAKDELVGGYVNIYGAAHTDSQLRLIIGNEASAIDAAVVLTLDGPLDTAVVAATSAYEIFQNPYTALAESTNAALAKLGPPAAYVSAANMYFWCRVKGPSWMACEATVTGHGGVAVCFRHNGALEGLETALGATVNANDTSQYAGYRMIGSADGNGPLVMLQG